MNWLIILIRLLSLIFFSVLSSREKTTEVLELDKGKKAIGPYLVNVWKALLFLILVWSIMVVKALFL